MAKKVGRSPKGPHKPEIQPTTPVQIAASAICARHGNKPDELLEIFHEMQHDLGYVPEETLPIIAKVLNRSRAEIYGVLTFYHEFHRHPVGKHVVKICRAEACQAMGGVEADQGGLRVGNGGPVLRQLQRVPEHDAATAHVLHSAADPDHVVVAGTVAVADLEVRHHQTDAAFLEFLIAEPMDAQVLGAGADRRRAGARAPTRRATATAIARVTALPCARRPVRGSPSRSSCSTW